MLVKTVSRYALAAAAVGLVATAGTSSAQKSPTGSGSGSAVGGAAYGGATYGAKPTPAPAPVTEATPPEPAAEPAPAPQYETPPPTEEAFYKRLGIAMALGGGVEGFESPSHTGTHTGGGWTVRATFGTRSILGFEASYIGSAQEINMFGLDHNAVLVGNGAQASLRLNLTPQYDFGVFLLGGAAWRHYSLSNTAIATADVRNHDDVLEIPFGLGISYTYEGLLLDARGDYRLTEYSNMFAGASNSDMNRWSVQGNIGYQF